MAPQVLQLSHVGNPRHYFNCVIALADGRRRPRFSSEAHSVATTRLVNCVQFVAVSEIQFRTYERFALPVGKCHTVSQLQPTRYIAQNIQCASFCWSMQSFTTPSNRWRHITSTIVQMPSTSSRRSFSCKQLRAVYCTVTGRYQEHVLTVPTSVLSTVNSSRKSEQVVRDTS